MQFRCCDARQKGVGDGRVGEVLMAVAPQVQQVPDVFLDFTLLLRGAGLVPVVRERGEVDVLQPLLALVHRSSGSLQLEQGFRFGPRPGTFLL